MSSFNVFEVMKKSPPAEKGETSLFLSIAEAISHMDRLASIMIASSIQWNSGISATYAHECDIGTITGTAKKSALFIYSEEQRGSPLVREFSEECWKELIAVRSLFDVQSFCQSPSMNPSVLCRVILTEKK